MSKAKKPSKEKLKEAVESEVINLEAPETEEAVEAEDPVQEIDAERMTVAEMREAGILPPERASQPQQQQPQPANPESQKEQAQEQVQQSAQPEVHNAATALTDEQQKVIWDRHANRGSMALQAVLAIVGEDAMDTPAGEVVDYAFKLADGIQREIDNGYKMAMLEAQVNPQS